MSRDVANVIWLSLSKATQVVLQISLTVIMTRAIGPEGMGKWALVLAAATFLYSLFFNWLHAANLRFGREQWVNEGNVERITTARTPLTIAGFIISALLIYFDPYGWIFRVFGLSDSWRTLILLCLLGIWLVSEARTSFQIRYAMKHIAAMPIVANSLVIIFLIFVMNVSGFSDLRDGDRSFFVVSGIVVVSALFWLLVVFKEWLRLGLRFSRGGDSDIRVMVSYGWPLLPGFLIGYISDWGDHVLLRYFMSDDSVGIFYTANRIFVAVLAISTPLSTLLLPKFIGQRNMNPDIEKEFLGSIFPTLFVLWALIIIPTLVVLPFIFAWVVGTEYEEATTSFVVLSIAVPGSLLATICGVFFDAQGRMFRSVVIYHSIMVVANIAISIILIPRYGVIGAAIGTAVSYIFVQLLYFKDQSRHLQVPESSLAWIFGLLMAFSILQALVPAEFFIRILLGLLAMICVIWITTARGIASQAVLERLIPTPIMPIRRHIIKLLCSQKQGK